MKPLSFNEHKIQFICSHFTINWLNAMNA